MTVLPAGFNWFLKPQVYGILVSETLELFCGNNLLHQMVHEAL